MISESMTVRFMPSTGRHAQTARSNISSSSIGRVTIGEHGNSNNH